MVTREASDGLPHALSRKLLATLSEYRLLVSYLVVAVTLCEGSSCRRWSCPRVRGHTRGFNPASRSGIQLQKPDAHP